MYAAVALTLVCGGLYCTTRAIANRRTERFERRARFLVLEAAVAELQAVGRTIEAMARDRSEHIHAFCETLQATGGHE